MTPPFTRRQFLSTAAAATAGLAAGSLSPVSASSALMKATDRVTLGKTGIQVSRVGMGTGTSGVQQSSNQVKLGLKAFTRVVRHALDRGICFFDVADQYGSHVFLREALRGVPREQYVIQTKTHADKQAIARSHLERYRLELGVDYIDVVLMHCMTEANWPQKYGESIDTLMKAREDGLIRAHGVSCHGIDPLRTAAKHPFVQVDLARINPQGLAMDDKDPSVVASELQEMHDRGVGVVGMKILGAGRINTPDQIDESLQFVLGLGTVNAFVIGFESPEQIDDLLARADKAMKGAEITGP